MLRRNKISLKQVLCCILFSLCNRLPYMEYNPWPRESYTFQTGWDVCFFYFYIDIKAWNWRNATKKYRRICDSIGREDIRFVIFKYLLRFNDHIWPFDHNICRSKVLLLKVEYLRVIECILFGGVKYMFWRFKCIWVILKNAYF